MTIGEKPPLDYGIKPSRLNLRLIGHVAAVVDLLFAVLYAITKPIQLRQPDPFNNAWTIIAAVCLLGFVALWILMLTVALLNGRRPRLNALFYVWLAIAGVLIVRGVVQIYLFVFP